MKRLDRKFFERPTLDVARSILGCNLHAFGQTLTITESEAYIFSLDDLNKKNVSKRLSSMATPAGHTYIYLIYGVYHCINISTEQEGVPASIFLRAGIHHETQLHINGPGKLTKILGITTEHTLLDICNSRDIFFTEGSQITEIKTTPRIGVSSGQDLLWRFVATKDDVKSVIRSL